MKNQNLESYALYWIILESDFHYLIDDFNAGSFGF
jgi:hypothetical protein